ncbi:MAG: hypothetical protein JXP34_11580, partial [Planctomycetes bacterium]|nr:hypothetical protein [Planctomycetota bacterium]
MRCRRLILSIAATLVAAGALAADMTPTDLRCEYHVEPLGIDVAKPRLSWIVKARGRGQVQSAYRILVASSPMALVEDRGDLWDTGKVASDRTSQIAYEGKPLGSRAACCWKVRVWDGDDRPSKWSMPARWTMGLLAPEDWKAAWIGYDAPEDAKAAAAEPLSLEGCPWIWFPEGNPRERAPAGACVFRGRLEIPADRAIARARIRITADDQFELLVNGKKAGASDGQRDAWRRPQTIDVKGLLAPGANVLAVVATNTTDGAAGVVAKLVVEFETGDPIAFAAGGSWKAYGEAVAGAGEPGFDDAAWPAAKEIA